MFNAFALGHLVLSQVSPASPQAEEEEAQREEPQK